MPELPEVETVRRGLTPLIQGRKITAFYRYRDALRFPIPDLRFALEWRLGSLTRRGKYLLFELSCENATQGWLLVHLGMSGSLRFSSSPQQVHPHDQWCLQLDNGFLLYRDPRRFGRLSWFASGQDDALQQLLQRVGPEPLTPQFSAERLFQASRTSRQSVKVWLLNGRAVCGVGNIYACESLFVAAVDPFLPVMGLSWGECVRLFMAIRVVLSRAVLAGGTTLRDFHDAGGRPGYFKRRLWVYGREGEPCARCLGAVHRQEQKGRSTFFCPHCQANLMSERERLLSAGTVGKPSHRNLKLPFDKADIVLRL